jgi:hypothetical protein
VRFTPRGTRRLKGIDRPVALFAVGIGLEDVKRRTVVISPSRRLMTLGAGAFVLAALIVAAGILTARSDGAGGLAASASATAASNQAAAIDSASPSPTRDPTAWPTAAEGELLRAVGEDVEPHCDRADVDDRPVIVVDAGTAREFGITLEERIASHTGVACEISGAARPTSSICGRPGRSSTSAAWTSPRH